MMSADAAVINEEYLVRVLEFYKFYWLKGETKQFSQNVVYVFLFIELLMLQLIMISQSLSRFFGT